MNRSVLKSIKNDGHGTSSRRSGDLEFLAFIWRFGIGRAWHNFNDCILYYSKQSISLRIQTIPRFISAIQWKHDCGNQSKRIRNDGDESAKRQDDARCKKGRKNTIEFIPGNRWDYSNTRGVHGCPVYNTIISPWRWPGIWQRSLSSIYFIH